MVGERGEGEAEREVERGVGEGDDGRKGDSK